MLNRKHLHHAARLAFAGVSVLLCCACLVALHQCGARYGLGSLLFAALASGSVAGVCIRSFFVEEGHVLASGLVTPWLFLASGIATVLCLAALVGNVALRQLAGG